MPKTVLFDFDGTLADTIPAITEGVNLTMSAFGFPLHEEAAVRTFINHGARHLIRCAMPPELRADDALVDTVLADYDRSYRQTHLRTRELYPGMLSLLETLHSVSSIGVLSNKQDSLLQSLVTQLLPRHCCDAAQGGIAGYPQKPDPYLPTLLARKLGVSLSDCLLVGDSDVDVETARRCGMSHIGVTWGYRSAESLLTCGATCVANTAQELEQKLLQWLNGD